MAPLRSFNCAGRLIGARGRWVLLTDDGTKYRLDIDPEAQGIELYKRYPWVVELSDTAASGRVDKAMQAKMRRDAGSRRRTCSKCGEDKSLLSFRKKDDNICDRCRFERDAEKMLSREQRASLMARTFPTFNSIPTISGGLPTLGKRR